MYSWSWEAARACKYTSCISFRYEEIPWGTDSGAWAGRVHLESLGVIEVQKNNTVPIKSQFLQYEITQAEILALPFQKKKQTPKVVIWRYWGFSVCCKKKLSWCHDSHGVVFSQVPSHYWIFIFCAAVDMDEFGGEGKQKKVSQSSGLSQ